MCRKRTRWLDLPHLSRPSASSTHVSRRSSRSRRENGFSFALYSSPPPSPSISLSLSLSLYPVCLSVRLPLPRSRFRALLATEFSTRERTASLLRHALITYLDAAERNSVVRHMFRSHCARHGKKTIQLCWLLDRERFRCGSFLTLLSSR